ncbi:LCCL domain-containing protein [Hyphomonas sp.]|uniref:LCCL domain-containing protein n=1 Tax=Hyphomonas sp. TaxID=87 RepID=UPI0025BB636F|nr:LCCL domain-containing protein [Hyphomonas sp.]
MDFDRFVAFFTPLVHVFAFAACVLVLSWTYGSTIDRPAISAAENARSPPQSAQTRQSAPEDRAADGAALCPPTGAEVRGRITCSCTMTLISGGVVRGTNIYASSSNFCRAAVHAGVIPPSGGEVTATGISFQSSFFGTSRNGIMSEAGYAGSSAFIFNPDQLAPVAARILPEFMPANCPIYVRDLKVPYQCHCPAESLLVGNVVGTGLYAPSSVVCRAGLHAGAISNSGGIVEIHPAGQSSLFLPSVRYGITSRGADKPSESYVFARDQQVVGFQAGETIPFGVDPLQSAFPSVCPSKAGDLTQPLLCWCGENQGRSNRVWGTGTYTGDSSLCMAAVHAGVVGRSGGNVEVKATGPQTSFAGSVRNGIESQSYGAWNTSFAFRQASVSEPELVSMSGPASGAVSARVACPETWGERRLDLTCGCGPLSSYSGGVWGAGIYRSDSSVCRSAVHKGVLEPEGGEVTVYFTGAQTSFAGTVANGVTSLGAKAASSSFSFRASTGPSSENSDSIAGPAADNRSETAVSHSAAPGAAQLQDADAKIIDQAKAEFPSRAAARGLEGACTVTVTVLDSGEPADVTASCSDSVFKREAERIGKRSTYAPAIRGGRTVDRETVQFEVEFQLSE